MDYLNKSMGMLLVLMLYLNSLFAQKIDTIEVYDKYQIKFNSEKNYDNYITDVRVRATFEGPKGISITQDAFWNGGSLFEARFAPSIPGNWKYSITSSDLGNSQLNSITGDFFVEEYTGDKPYKKLGWLKVSDNDRYLSYNDGTPFFYLGDTAWELARKSTREELLKYLNDRASKGFTAIQFVPQSHLRLYNYGVKNQYGETYFIDNDFSKLNPRYFDYVDVIVDSINAKGMVAVIVPLWAAMNELHHDEQWKENYLTNEESLLIPRYLGARYAADNVIWIVGGDNTYKTEEQKDFWNNFADLLKDASGGRQLATVHTSGWNASFDFFENSTPWLDFHMYQSSHIARAEYTIIAARTGYEKEPIKPVLNGEAVYEDIYNRLWAPGDTTKVETFRIRPEHVRQAGYESILAGALVGYTYGANGIWQWHTEGLWGTHSPRYYAMEAINFPGSSNMTVLKSIMEKNQWYRFEPKPEYIASHKSRNKITTAVSDRKLISYFATGTINVEYRLPLDKGISSAKFVNPVTGEEVSVNNVDLSSHFWVQPPDTMDWVFLADLKNIEVELPDTPKLYQNYPNPFNPTTSISFFLKEKEHVKITIYDVTGKITKVLDNSLKEPGFHVLDFESRSLSSGIYFYELKTSKARQVKKMILIK